MMQMPLTVLHAATGAATGATFYMLERTLTDKPVDTDALMDNLVHFGIAGALPDILEPPTHRGHRSFFHSFLTLAGSLYAFSKLDSREDLTDQEKSMKKAHLVAYLSHLLMDSTTPMGLPIVL